MSNSLRPHGLYSPWNSPGQNTGMGSRSLLQGIFPTQESNPGLPHWRQILYQLNHQGSPRILEWLAYPSEKVMAPHSSTLAWKIPWTEEPGRLQSMGSLRVGHDWVTSLSLFLSFIGEGNGNPLQCSCLENPRDGGAWWVAVYGVAQSRTRLKRLSSSSLSLLQQIFPTQESNLDPLHCRWILYQLSY